MVAARSLRTGDHRERGGCLPRRDPIRDPVEILKKVESVHLLIGLRTNLNGLRIDGVLRTGVFGT